MSEASIEAEPVIHALSPARMSTYLHAADGDPHHALNLYGWNARVSASLLVPLHLVGVTTRNAVDDALTRVYGPCWPWEQVFERSLPQPPRHLYSPQRDLI